VNDEPNIFEVARLNADGSSWVIVGHPVRKYTNALKMSLNMIHDQRQQIESMKCCGNCEHYSPSAYGDHCLNPALNIPYEELREIDGDEGCDKWEMRK